MAIEFYEGEFSAPGNKNMMRVTLDCGRTIEFSVASVSEDRREWLAQRIEEQVNEIVRQETFKAVEGHKDALFNLIKPAFPLLRKT